MNHITLITVGKLKESYLRDGCSEYIKRLGAYTKLQIIEIAEERCSDKPTKSEIQVVLEKEGRRILEKIPKNSHTIALCIEGQSFSSEDFSKKIEMISLSNSHIVFIIGGSFGLANEVKTKAQTHLSFGKLTLPHQLARVVLLEQIYRAFSISNNSKYHK